MVGNLFAIFQVIDLVEKIFDVVRVLGLADLHALNNRAIKKFSNFLFT